VLIVLLLFDKLGHLIVSAVYRSITVTVNQENSEILEKRSRDIFKHHEIRIQEQSHKWFREKGEMQITFQVRAKNHMGSGSVVTALSQVEGVASVVWE
jgi:uncharacterized membrane protein YhiD involved in acid resistance